VSSVTVNDPYSARVRELFATHAHAGELAGAVVVARSDQGIRVVFSAHSEKDRLEKLRYRVWGCPHSIAACEASCAELEGQTVQHAEEFSITELMQSLAVPAEKSARILVIEDVVRQLGAALRQSAQSNGQN
jgi:NifU-like protein involved in Fe-S cluster formation